MRNRTFPIGIAAVLVAVVAADAALAVDRGSADSLPCPHPHVFRALSLGSTFPLPHSTIAVGWGVTVTLPAGHPDAVLTSSDSSVLCDSGTRTPAGQPILVGRTHGRSTVGTAGDSAHPAAWAGTVTVL